MLHDQTLQQLDDIIFPFALSRNLICSNLSRTKKRLPCNGFDACLPVTSLRGMTEACRGAPGSDHAGTVPRSCIQAEPEQREPR